MMTSKGSGRMSFNNDFLQAFNKHLCQIYLILHNGWNRLSPAVSFQTFFCWSPFYLHRNSRLTINFSVVFMVKLIPRQQFLLITSPSLSTEEGFKYFIGFYLGKGSVICQCHFTIWQIKRKKNKLQYVFSITHGILLAMEITIFWGSLKARVVYTQSSI